jgi:hypothetical protein
MDFFESSPDVAVQDFQLLVECKSRQRHAFHAFMEQARKYCGPDEVPALVTKSHGEHGEIISLSLDTFASILDELRHHRLNTQIHMAEIEGDHEALGEAMREKLALRRGGG